MTAYYNEIDPYAAQWLRNLIATGHIAPGVVDERSIVDVKPSELSGYTQCHFFAGIGVWSYALRMARWPDNRPVWTGSCPCQPFSAAGKGVGFDDERHLWPHFHWLIEQCKPAVVIGEQVASKAAEPWLDLVQTDLEALGYAFGAVAFPSAGVGAPHIRDRSYWVGHTDIAGLERLPGHGGATERQGASGPVAAPGVSGGMADPDGLTSDERRADDRGRPAGSDAQPRARFSGHGVLGEQSAAGPVNGLWSDADWLFCRDGKWRPVEPGTFPLVDGAAARVGRSGADWHTPAGEEGQGHRAGRLKGYGNAINAEAATQFIGAYMENVRMTDLLKPTQLHDYQKECEQ